MKRANEIEEEKCLEIIEKYSKEYQRQVLGLALIMNKVAKYIPNRRKRKLHIGLFGYSRGLEIGDRRITLPRAIKFTASLYSCFIFSITSTAYFTVLSIEKHIRSF